MSILLAVTTLFRMSLRSLCLTLALGVGLPAALAGKHDGVEEGRHKKEKSHRGDHDDERRSGGVRGDGTRAAVRAAVQIPIGGYFEEAQRRAARDYYEPRWRAGKCPPGLAKKDNGCQPPGQARQWQRGQPLPRSVVVYNVPTSVQLKLGTPPPGHKFVRVATDILLIAVGTGMVIDAIEDLGQL